MNIRLLLLTCLLSFGLTACDDYQEKQEDTRKAYGMYDEREGVPEEDPGRITVADNRAFVVEVTGGHRAAIAMAKLATEANDGELTSLAEEMAKTHQHALSQLMAIGKEEMTNWPEDILPHQERLVENIREAGPEEARKAFVEAALDLHRQMQDVYEESAQTLKHPKLLAHATEFLPVVTDHVERLEQLEEGNQ